MNMWGFTPDFLDELEKGFKEFLGGLKDGDIKSEYLLPSVVDQLLKMEKQMFQSLRQMINGLA